MRIDVGVPSLLQQRSRMKPGRNLVEVRDARHFDDGALLADEEWPTTQRFSRRAGEAFRGADYAAAVEAHIGSSVRDAAIAIVVVMGTLLGAAVTILWQV